jgi:hypothetical protein
VGRRVAAIDRDWAEGGAMSGTLIQMSNESIRRWHALAERRRRHYVELYRSDKWRRHYSEETFTTLMRDVIQNVEAWNKVLESMQREGPAVASRH